MPRKRESGRYVRIELNEEEREMLDRIKQRPSREEFMEEWRKAERALTIFAAGREAVEEYYRLEERIKEVEKELKKLRKLTELASSLKLEL